MPTRKQKPPAQATNPAFVVADAKHTDFLGLTKREAFGAVIAMGIFAGPSGRAILDSRDDAMLERVADVAFHMGDVMLARSHRA